MTEPGRVPTPAEVADRMAITEIIHTYCRGLDRADADILKSTCWPDAEVDYGFLKGNAHDFLSNLPAGLRRYRNTQHQVSNTLIFLDGDRASAETYLTAHHYLEVPDSDNTEMTYIGRYLDHLEKRDNVWKISLRRIVMTWHQFGHTTEDFEANASLSAIARATHDPDDPSFEFLADTR